MEKKNSSKLMDDEIILHKKRFIDISIVIFFIVFNLYFIFCYFYLSDSVIGLFLFKTPFVFFFILFIPAYIFVMSSNKVIVTNKRIILSYGYLFDLIRRNLTNKSFSILYSEIDSICEEKKHNKSFLKTVKINLLNQDFRPISINFSSDIVGFLVVAKKQLIHYKEYPQLYEIDSRFVRPLKYAKKRRIIVDIIIFSLVFVSSYFIGYIIGFNCYKQIDYIFNYSIPNYVIKYNPNQGRPYYCLSLYYYCELNDIDKAIENAEKAIKFAPNNKCLLGFLDELHAEKRAK